MKNTKGTNPNHSKQLPVEVMAACDGCTSSVFLSLPIDTVWQDGQAVLAELTTTEARELAAELLRSADAADFSAIYNGIR